MDLPVHYWGRERIEVAHFHVKLVTRPEFVVELLDGSVRVCEVALHLSPESDAARLRGSPGRALVLFVPLEEDYDALMRWLTDELYAAVEEAVRNHG